MKTPMTPEQRIAKNLAQKAYRANIKAAKASAPAECIITRSEEGVHYDHTPKDEVPVNFVPPLLHPSRQAPKAPGTPRAKRRTLDALPSRVFAARIPHEQFDMIKAGAKAHGVTMLQLILEGTLMALAAREAL
jgi:hypothetical protein